MGDGSNDSNYDGEGGDGETGDSKGNDDERYLDDRHGVSTIIIPMNMVTKVNSPYHQTTSKQQKLLQKERQPAGKEH